MNRHGISQMERVGDYLSDRGCRIDVMISSPLQRARMSAEIIASQIGYEKSRIMMEPLFTERSFGEAEGMVWTEGMYLDNGKYGEESIEALCRRADAGIGKYLTEDSGNILIVAHGAVLKAAVAVLTKGEIAYADDSVRIMQGGILCVKYEKENVEQLQQCNIY